MYRLASAVCVLALAFTSTCPTLCVAGVESSGNTDGVLTWQLGTLEAGKSARQVVLFVFDGSYAKASKRLDAARKQFAVPVESPKLPKTPHKPGSGSVWINNGTTDFALAGPGSFFWESERQSLKCPKGGQLSRFGYYIYYNDGADRKAGTPVKKHQAENLNVVEPIRPVDKTQMAGLMETGDKKLSVRVRAMLGEGPVAAVEFTLTNATDRPLSDVRLSAYANVESAHSHQNDYSTLDAPTGGWLAVDAASGFCVIMAGLDRPSGGHSGTWASQRELQAASGTALDKWPKFVAVPSAMKKRLSRTARSGVPHAPAGPTKPDEPETRDLTPQEAQEVLRRDWLFQADGKPSVERTLREIQWARELAARLRKNPKTPDLSSELAKLDALEKRLSRKGPHPGPLPKGEGEAVYLAVREVKRRIAFKNPAVNFSKVLFIDNPYPRGGEWPHQARHRDGMMATPGGRLLVLDGLHPGGRIHKLAASKPGSFWRPDLSFDARRVLFCYKAHDQSSFHLYEINVDGSGLRQLTSGPYDDLDPIYLPDGHIIFSTTRSNTYVRCMPYTYAYVLARCDADGKNVYLVSRNNEPDWCPALLNDGRVAYSRWEYHDKALWRIQSLWAMNPDGTNVVTFWGNQSVWPDHLAEPRPIPGSRRVMFTGLAHHDWFAGSIGIIDQDKGFNFPHGLTKVTCDVPWPECGTPPSDPHEAADYHVSGKYVAYKTPYPLSEEDFLVSARAGVGKSRTSGRERFKLYLMDVHGNRELIYEGHYNVWHAIPVTPRARPHQQPDRVVWPGTGKDRKPPQPGTLYSRNVYQGVNDLPKGSVKYLRVIQMDSRTYSTWRRDGRFSGPVVSAVQDDGVKRILGTVPVQADGSVAFKVPSGKALHFQLLDERYRALHTMRSFTGVMPGERRGCVGCHELHSVTPPNGTGLALRESARQLDPPPWGTTSISYERLVQPVLDQYCGKCHQGDGEARKDYDLTLRPGQGVFTEPYLTLIGYANYLNFRDPHGKRMPEGPPGIAGALMCENFAQSNPESYQTFRPMRYLSRTSRLIEMASNGKHYEVKVDPIGMRKLIGWVDANCPYRGDEEVRAIPDPNFAGIDQLPIRPRTKTAPNIPRP